MHFATLAVDTPGSRLASRLGFFVGGFSLACWAPLVPYVKARLGMDDAELGLMILFLGIGSVLAMPLAGALTSRIGCRVVFLAGALLAVLSLPVLAFADSATVLASGLFVSGLAMGAIDVAANTHGVEVQKAAGQPILSNFHAFFSIGGLSGAGGCALLLTLGLSPLATSLVAAGVMVVAMVLIAPRMLSLSTGGGGQMFVRPRGVVVLLGLLTCVVFLVEGALLDWGGVLLTDSHGLPPHIGGLGYALWALAVMCCRFAGGPVVRALGERRVLIYGGIIGGIGVLVAAVAPPMLAPVGFAIAGIGASNIVPVLFTAAGRQTVMPVALAIAAVTMIGYSGILVGPALVGLVGHAIGLPACFILLALLMLVISAGSRGATR